MYRTRDKKCPKFQLYRCCWEWFSAGTQSCRRCQNCRPHPTAISCRQCADASQEIVLRTCIGREHLGKQKYILPFRNRLKVPESFCIDPRHMVPCCREFGPSVSNIF